MAQSFKEREEDKTHDKHDESKHDSSQSESNVCRNLRLHDVHGGPIARVEEEAVQIEAN